MYAWCFTTRGPNKVGGEGVKEDGMVCYGPFLRAPCEWYDAYFAKILQKYRMTCWQNFWRKDIGILCFDLVFSLLSVILRFDYI